MNLSEEQRIKARSLGLGDEHYSGWNLKWTPADLAKYYLDNPDWCMEQHFPSLEDLKANLNGDSFRALGVFVDASATARATLPRYVFVKSYIGMLVGNVTRMYLSEGSKAKIIVENGGFLIVDYYDDCEIDIETRGSGKCIINQKGTIDPKVNGPHIKIRKRK